MKSMRLPTVVFLCCLLFLTTIGYAAATDPLLDWAFVDSSFTGEGCCVVQTSDGGYAVCGTHYLLAKFNSTGGMQWQKIFESQKWDTAYALIQTADGGYAFTGGGSFNFAKTDSQGNLQWTRTLLDPNGGMLCGQCLAQTKEGGYLIFGSVNASVSDWLFKTDQDGFVEWNMTCSLGARDALGFPLSLSAAPEDTYLLSGSLGLLKIESNGIILWADRAIGGLAVAAQDDGYLVMNSSATMGYLTKIDSQGNITWNRGYTQIKGENGVTFERVATTGDGGFVVCGLAGRHEKQMFGSQTMVLYYFAHVTKVNASGDVEWSTLYEATGPPMPSLGNYLNSIIADSNGGIVFTGRTGGHLWLVKLTDKTSAVQASVSASPNIQNPNDASSNAFSLAVQWSFTQTTIALALVALVVALTITILLMRLRKNNTLKR
jgi:hypothetical protein